MELNLANVTLSTNAANVKKHESNIRTTKTTNSSVMRLFHFDVLVLGDSNVGKKTFMRQIKQMNNKRTISEVSHVEYIEKTLTMPGHGSNSKCNLKVWL